MSNNLESRLRNPRNRLARFYDAGPDWADRYTAVYLEPQTNGRNRWFFFRAMSADPYHPQGIGLSGESDRLPQDRLNCGGRVPRMGRSAGGLGRRVGFDDLPPQVQRCIVQDLAS